MSIKVVIADDSELIRGGWARVLTTESDIRVVGDAENGEEVLNRVAEQNPDVVLMDVRMPVVDGLEATRRLTERIQPHPQVLIVTAYYENEKYAVQALEAGARGFLSKDTPMSKLVDAIRDVHLGKQLFPPNLNVIIKRLRTGSALQNKLKLLNDRETDVLMLMAAGYSHAQIATKLHIVERTVKHYAQRIYEKLEVKNRTQAVAAAYEGRLVGSESSDSYSRQKDTLPQYGTNSSKRGRAGD